MPLPTQAQVSTAAHYAGAIVGTAFAIFGLEAKGISLDQVKAAIGAAGTVVNDLVVLAGIVVPLYTTIKGIASSSATGQAAAIGANKNTKVNPTSAGGAIITVTDTAMAVAALEADRKAS